jgi:hypothetical protein
MGGVSGRTGTGRTGGEGVQLVTPQDLTIMKKLELAQFSVVVSLPAWLYWNHCAKIP